MNSKKSLIITLIILIIVISAAALLYKFFAEDTAPGLAPLGGTNTENDSEITIAEDKAALSKEPIPDKRPLAPDFTVEDIEGNKYKLSDFRGKPVIVNFWASWCGPCKMEMPDFEELYKEYGNSINFLMVNMTDGRKETKEKASKYISNSEYTFPVYYDTATEAAYAYGVSSIPATFLIDSEGYPVVYGVGALDKKTLLSGIAMFPEFSE